MQQSQSIQIALDKQSDKTKKDYRIRLEASVKCISWLLKHGLPFRGHDESEDSNNRGLFLSLLEFYTSDIEDVKSVVLNNPPKNHQLTSPKIQKDIVHGLAVETSKLITMDIGDDLFTILQMSVVLRYVNGNGCVMERFLGISHISDTKAVSLINTIESILTKHGEINGLKTLILEKNPSTYYVHCFAHRLQLSLVAVAQNHDDVNLFFFIVGTVTNLVGASCKRRDIIRETQYAKVQEAIATGELEIGSGLNQEIGMKRASDTRWDLIFKHWLI
ncbi:Zinc finger MYM-type protein 1 [Linum grandiflorum]